MRKMCDKYRILESSWPVLLKTVKVIKNKESLRNCSSQEEPKQLDDEMSRGIQDGVLEQKKDIREKLRRYK